MRTCACHALSLITASLTEGSLIFDGRTAHSAAGQPMKRVTRVTRREADHERRQHSLQLALAVDVAKTERRTTNITLSPKQQNTCIQMHTTSNLAHACRLE